MNTIDPSRISIVIETENLESAELAGLRRCLISLAQQSVPMDSVHEVLLLANGAVPSSLVETLCAEFPWLSTHGAPTSLGYYETKNYGARLARGDYVAFVDSDCQYKSTWLASLIAGAAQTGVSCGATSIAIDDWYGVANAVVYVFEPPSRDTVPIDVDRYMINNVVFERQLLIDRPIPEDTRHHRGNCALHAHALRSSGQRILCVPGATSEHASPVDWPTFTDRYLQMGAETLAISHALHPQESRSAAREALRVVRVLGGKLQRSARWVGYLLSEPDRRWLNASRLILGAPVVCAALGLFSLGTLIEAIRPGLLHERSQEQVTA